MQKTTATIWIHFSGLLCCTMKQFEASLCQRLWPAQERQIWALTSFTAAVEKFMHLR